MSTRRRPNSPPVGPATPQHGRAANGGRSRPAQDWVSLLRRIERKRRTLERDLTGDGDGQPPPALPADYYARATWVSFRLDGLDVTEEEVRDALGPGAERPVLRSRQALRIRNHAAILHRIENDLQQGLPLATDGVIRWYVGVSAGLSTTAPDQATAARIEEVVRRVNSPQLRLQPALQEVAATHARLLADPLVPSFNGILARLLLRYHLGRCKLPAVVFDPVADARQTGGETTLRRLVELLEQSYDLLLRGRG